MSSAIKIAVPTPAPRRRRDSYRVVASEEDQRLTTPFTAPNIDWSAYVNHRPHYPETLFEVWGSYHQGPLKTVHDVGAGCGVLAAEFASRGAAHVKVSDPGQTHMATAARLLVPNFPSTQFSFHCGPGEKGWLPAASVDLVCIGEAAHWMDAEAAARAAAESLRPGGTFAAVFYGIFGNFTDCPAAGKAFERVFDEHADHMFHLHNRVEPAVRRGVRQYMTGLDFVPFPEELFEDVRRFEVNVPNGTPRWAAPLPKHIAPAESKVAAGEHKETYDDGSWSGNYTVEWLKGFLEHLYHGYDDRTWNSEAWHDLEAAVRENGGSVHITWPVALVMGRRRE